MVVFSRMNGVKKVFVGLLLLAVVVFSPAVSGLYKNTYTFATKSVCDVPISYKIGVVDPRFEVSRGEFLSSVEKATYIWETPTEKNLFMHDSKGVLTVNLVFDQRQALHNTIDNLEGQLKQGESSITTQIQQYEARAASFRQKTTALNESISYWNDRGGAPKEEYDKLIEERDKLRVEAGELNDVAKSLNIQTNDYNSGVNNLNQTIETFNEALNQKPEEGLYSPKEQKIDIYFNFNTNELIHTLAHEFGHALGLMHTTGKDSILYPYTTRTTAATLEDLNALSKICQKNYASEKIKTFVNELFYKNAESLNK